MSDNSLDTFALLVKGKSDDEIYENVVPYGGVEQIADSIMSGMMDQLDPDLAQDCVMGYCVKTPTATLPYRIEVQAYPPGAVVTKSEPHDARVTVEISAADMFRLLVGDLDSMAAFGDGRLRIEGDVMFAIEAQGMFQMA